MADVLIAGGGPAGTTLAILLGRAGLSVELYEARRFPRDKPCGEGIMPAGVAVLERLGLRKTVGGRALRSVRYHGFGMSAEARFPTAGPALAQRRLVLDDVLWEAARGTEGVRLYEDAPVEGAAIEGERAVGLRVGGETRRGGLIVGADGIESVVRRSLGLDERHSAAGLARRRIGLRRHFRLAPGTRGPDRLEIFLGRGHELYVAPLPDGELLVAALCDRQALQAGGGGAVAPLQRWIAEEQMLTEWLDGAIALDAPAGRAPVTRAARRGFAPGAVLLGDAAEASDPLTAGGIAHALVTAEHLAPAVRRYFVQGDVALARFERERARLLRAHRWLTAALVATVRRPPLARATLFAMRAAPRIMQYLTGVAGGVGIGPPLRAQSRTRIAAPISSAPALPISSATDQNATLSQRAGSA